MKTPSKPIEEMTPEEVQKALLNVQRSIFKKVDDIRTILVFFFILTLLGIVIAFLGIGGMK